MIDFNFLKGKIIYNEFHIFPDIPLSQQIDELIEDMLQVEYMGNYMLDLGWYPELNTEGNFKLVVIKDFDWEFPVYERTFKDCQAVQVELQNAEDYILEKMEAI